MPADFSFPSPLAEFWIPLRVTVATTDRDTHRYSVIGRLAHDATPERAAAQLDALHARLMTAR
jgi:hypothetical protein